MWMVATVNLNLMVFTNATKFEISICDHKLFSGVILTFIVEQLRTETKIDIETFLGVEGT